MPPRWTGSRLQKGEDGLALSKAGRWAGAAQSRLPVGHRLRRGRPVDCQTHAAWRSRPEN